MIVRDRIANRRAPREPAGLYTFQAPIRGLVLNESIISGGEASARILDNWTCTTTGVVVRGGSQAFADFGEPVLGLHTYKVGAIENLFATTASGIYDLTSHTDPTTAPSPVVSGLTGGEFTMQQFGTAGGDFLMAANGLDPVRIYDGVTWENASITGATPAELSHVWTYANRLFFIQRNSMNAWYLGIDSIAGEATKFPLASVFRKGGKLLFGATWSMDAGDGLDDKCVFVTDAGEAAIYEGIDPASWRLAGLYEITQPRGKNATMRAGGDLLIATNAGLVPLSEAIRKDRAALDMAAVSAPIAPMWERLVDTYGDSWSVVKWTDAGLMLVTVASPSDDTETLVANLKTGAWSRWTGISIRCASPFAGRMYSGGNDGKVRLLEAGGMDGQVPYTAVYLGNASNMGIPAQQKTLRQARAQFKTSHDMHPLVSAQVDYEENIGSPQRTSEGRKDALWDVAIWDVDVWPSKGGPRSVTGTWSSIGRTGYVAAPEVQIRMGSDAPPDIELVSVAVTYQVGAVVA